MDMDIIKKRPVLLLLDKSGDGYSDDKVVVGEFFIDATNGYGYIKTKDSQIIELKGAGFTELTNYIKNTTAINVPPLDKHSFHIDDSLKVPSGDAKTGVLKIRVPSSEGLNEFQEVSLTTNGKHCIVVKEDGSQISVEEFFKDYDTFKKGSDSSSKDHQNRITKLEKNIDDRAIDSVIHYKHFTQEEVGDLLFKISPDKDTREVFKNEFESTITLGTDDGTSINKHFLGLTVDNIEHTYNANHFYIRDKGNVVDLAVKFYYKDGDIYIRPTQTEGEFILRDKSTNKGTFKKFKGVVSEESWRNTGLTPANEIRPIGQARNEESTSFVCRQDAHGFTSMTLVHFDAESNTWKKSNLDHRAMAVLVPIDENYFYTYTNGHIRIPDNVADNFTSNKLYYLSQTEDGGMQTEEPIYIYQEIGYCYSKNSIKWFAISIGTPVELAPYVVKDFATKTEMNQRVRYVDSVSMIPNIIEPEGCVIIVADNDNWHTRKVSAEKGKDGIALQNGLYANVASSDTELKAQVDSKFDKGKETSNQLRDFPNAVAVIDELRKKLTVPDDFHGGFEALKSLIDSKIPKANISQSMTDNAADNVVSSAVFKQLVDLVHGIAEGGAGAIVPQDNTPVHIEEGTLSKTQRTITSKALVLYNPILTIEGQVIPRDKYDFTTNGGVINLKEAYSDVADVKYVLIDIFPTDIRFIADTAGAVAAAPYSNSLKAGDVIKVLGRAEKYDGGGHLRVVSNSRGEDALELHGGLYLNKVPYTDGKQLKEWIDAKVSGTTFNEFKSSALAEINKRLKIEDAWRIYVKIMSDEMTTGVDLNNIWKRGNYVFGPDAYMKNVTNAPSKLSHMSGTLTVTGIDDNGTYCNQIWLSYSEVGTMAIRSKTSAGWGEWVYYSSQDYVDQHIKDTKIFWHGRATKRCIRDFRYIQIGSNQSSVSFEIDKPSGDITTTIARASSYSLDGYVAYHFHARVESQASSDNKIKITVSAYLDGLKANIKTDTAAIVEIIMIEE